MRALANTMWPALLMLSMWVWPVQQAGGQTRAAIATTKPAPDPYLRAAAKIGLAPGECAAVEDSKHGVQSARAAGIGFIIALGDKKQHSYLSRLPGVKLVVENLGQIPAKDLFASNH